VGWIRRLTPRAEKTIRLVVTCVIAAPLGMISVANDNETLGFIAVGVVLGGILAGPAVTRMLFPPGGSGTGR
jgi:hypothetical protein